VEALAVRYADASWGIITRRDMVRHLAQPDQARCAADLASYPLRSVPATMTLLAARKVFMEYQIRHLGVVADDGKLLAIISMADIRRYPGLDRTGIPVRAARRAARARRGLAALA